MRDESTHGGYAGKSLVEKIRDDLDEAYREYQEHDCNGGPAQCGETNTGTPYGCGIRNEAFAEGIAHALGILRSTSCDDEWNQAEQRWKEKHSGI